MCLLRHNAQGIFKIRFLKTTKNKYLEMTLTKDIENDWASLNYSKEQDGMVGWHHQLYGREFE